MKENKALPAAEKLGYMLESLSAFSDGIEELVYIIDPEKHEVVFANRKTKELFGEDIIGEKCYKVFSNLDGPCPSCTNKYVLGENIGKTYTHEYLDEENKHWYRISSKAIKWLENKYVKYAIAIDITEQKKTQEELLKSEKRFRDLITTAPVVIYTLSPDGKITSLNQRFEEITGWRCEEWLGKSFESLIHPEDLPLAIETSQKVFSGERPPPYELRVLSKSGEYLVGEFTSAPIIEDGKVVGEFGVVQDITGRKRVESALRESEELFRSVVENSHNAILIVDDNFKIIYANDELASSLINYPKEEITGQDFRKFLDEGSRSLVEERYIRRQRGEQVPPRYEFKVVRKDGEKRDVEIRSTTIRDKYGRVRTVAQLLDVTERKRFEEKLSVLNAYGQQLNMAKNMEEIYKLTLDAMRKTLGFECASIFIVEEKNLRLVAHKGYPKPRKLVLPLDGEMGIVTRVTRTCEPVNVPDVRKDRAYVKTTDGMFSKLAVPIKIGNKVLGVLNVESHNLAAFSEEDKKLLEILASHAATAISNLERQEILAAVNAYGRSLIKAKGMDEVYALTLEAMHKLLGFTHMSIFLVEGNKLKLIASRGLEHIPKLELPLNGRNGVTVKAVKMGKPIYVPDVRKDESYVKGAAEDILSELAVPIKVGNKVLGVLDVESHNLAAFEEDDWKRLEILASYVAIATSNIRRRENLALLSKKFEYLIKSATKIMQTKDVRKRLREIAKTIQTLGWRKVTISLRDENLELKDIVAAGLTKEEIKVLRGQKIPGTFWKELLGPKFEKYKIGDFYYLSRNDPQVSSKVFSEYFIAYYAEALLYTPIRTPEGRIVGILTMANPADARKPTRETLMPIELFLHHAAKTIESAQLIEDLEKARKELKVYAGQLEQKVEERTRALVESQNKILKVQRLAAIGELAGMVGHDLRNPLTSMLAATYYLKKRLAQEGKIKEMIELIEKNITYSNKIISDLLDYSREIKLELVETSSKAIVEDVLSFVEIPKNVRLINHAKNTLKIRMDAEKMKRVFINLIRNAVEAMPNGGTLTIKSEKVRDTITFAFSDTGVGMSEEVLKRLWNPLFTTKAKGMGLGLAICKRFVEAHGGSIDVKSTLGKGTTFTVKVPIEPKMEEGGEKVWVKQLESSLLTTTKT